MSFVVIMMASLPSGATVARASYHRRVIVCMSSSRAALARRRPLALDLGRAPEDHAARPPLHLGALRVRYHRPALVPGMLQRRLVRRARLLRLLRHFTALPS